jgi:hypothetical protein
MPLVRLKHEEEFVLGIEQKKALEKIVEYLTEPLVLRAPKANKEFKLYISAQERLIGAAFTQEDAGMEFTVAYVS